jgi:AcrR family transcriptional regulator
MARLSRQESQQVTRLRLIETAEKEIIRVGIYEASIRHICDVAGYTLGAFYSNFKSKDELLLEVLELQTEREFEILRNVVTLAASLDEKEILKKIAGWLRQLQKNKILSGTLSLEFEVYANHNSSFKVQYNKNKNQWDAELAKALEALFTGQHLTPKISFMQMAVGLSSLWDGFAMKGTVPGIDSVDKIILLFLESLLKSSKVAPKSV